MSIIPASPMPDILRNRAMERLNFFLCMAFMVGFFIVAYLLTFGPVRLHESDSMKLVAGLGIAWPVWSVIYLAVGVLLTNHVTRVVGYLVGAMLAAFYLISYIVSIKQGNNGSAPGLLSGYISIFSLTAGMLRSLDAAEWRRS